MDQKRRNLRSNSSKNFSKKVTTPQETSRPSKNNRTPEIKRPSSKTYLQKTPTASSKKVFEFLPSRIDSVSTQSQTNFIKKKLLTHSKPTKNAILTSSKDLIKCIKQSHTNRNSNKASELDKPQTRHFTATNKHPLNLASKTSRVSLLSKNQEGATDRVKSLTTRVSKKTIPSRNHQSLNVRNSKKSPSLNSKIVYSHKTKTGSTMGKSKKFNQDNYFIKIPFLAKNQSLVGVLDGHGVNGHKVSSFAKRALPVFLQNYLPKSNFYSVNDKKEPSSKEKFVINEAFKKAFLETNLGLNQSQKINIDFSGTTAVVVLIIDKVCFCANLGDSRAVIGSLENNKWRAIPLSYDHKPDDVLEKQRILEAGGQVEPFFDEDGEPIGPARIWVEGEGYPGLAMARSLGDKVGSEVGVIAEPQVMEHLILPNHKFIVLATDGIWEFMSNQECVEIVSRFQETQDPQGACDQLLKEAVKRWKKNESVIDDITIFVGFLN